jgi:sporulation protein YabP
MKRRDRHIRMISVWHGNMEETMAKHALTLHNRENMELDGVTEVCSFDEENVLVKTELGMLTVKGGTMQITLLDITNGKLSISGHIRSLEYSDKDITKKTSFFKNLFK